MNSRHKNGRKKRISRRQKRQRCIKLLIFEILLLIVILFAGFNYFYHRDRVKMAEDITIPEWIDVQYIDKGNPSRSGMRLDGINNIVIHYVGNPMTTAQQNRDFYNHEDSNVCSHFVVGMDGEIIMCIPLYERSAASNDRNHDTISIEVCHPDASGKFTDASYESLTKLVRWLLNDFNMKSDDVIRHFDVTGKECPLYYVKNPDLWEQFKAEL
ncbi:N-acetylmuramoyl-L-alanine amidase [Pseudobutyrivibrio sp. ACV-2]|uniref:peptidoglycan recognition protein family protein n=1 Tax=Pseudobutyrivibrio sp. ACV-2 TaxID=1520801 RepID=UPI000895D5DC|nr:peptidoglycan recognition family protein [Pseudobutyrivibrio sp. ACV-2]SEA91362.1 N-acetylmuramoyl-L-alanine amidase [Pseudobutyrivibrio sp. ACV-2]